jgi:hypothetical protein
LTVTELEVTGAAALRGVTTAGVGSSTGLVFASGASLTFARDGRSFTRTQEYSFGTANSHRSFILDTEATSDRRLKRDLAAIEAPLEKLGRLKGLYYHWIKGAQGKISGRRLDEKVRNAGFIAQDVQSVLPEGVVAIEDGKFLGINYEAVLAMVVEALKELNAKVDRVHADVEALQAFRAEQQKRMKDIGPGA